MSHTLRTFTVLAVVSLVLGPAALVAEAEPAAKQGPATQAPRNPEGIQGLWVWRATWVREADEREALVRFARTHGFNRLLVQIHRDKGADTPALKYPEQLADLIARAAEHGIAVEALDGGPRMARADRQAETLANLDLVLEFNRALPEGKRLVGVHYDIEPYVLDEWKADEDTRRTIMRDLVAFYHKVRRRLDAEPVKMTLAADIPFWYDNKNEPGDDCTLEYEGRTKNLHKHIQDVCDYVGIMSYRRKATGRNSVAAVVRNELAYAEQIGKTITPALETIPLSDVPQISFAGTSPAQFWRVHNEVRAELADHPGFGGMLTHSYRGLRELLASTTASRPAP
ncbi:MAG: hypothetical protein ACOC9P_02810 [bacterium]